MTTFITRSLLPCTLALLVACGDDGNTSTTVDATTTGDTTAVGETTGATAPTTAPTTGATTDEPTSTTGTTGATETNATTTGGDSTTDATTSGTTTGVARPCDICEAGASCKGGDDECTCDPGFKTAGDACEDIDECAGNNACAVDATCSNTPGSFECTCNAGYKGNGETCNDIDECNEDLDNCSTNATCTNQDGAFKCECKQGFTGDGITCNGSKKFGDPCKLGEDCASGLCLTDGVGMCTVTCTQDVANDCGGQGVTGLCIEAAVDTFVCAGPLTFGTDKDDEVMQDGDSVKRNFQTKTDADVFLIKIAVAGMYEVVAFPDLDDDLQVEFYNADASELATVDTGKIGEPDGGVVTAEAGGILFAVVRNIGTSNGSFTISVTKQ